ncbi:unnamed protein product [Cunninghamella echinulata]
MYDENLKYITISYRWGELNEQLVPTPDYIAHITSFDLRDLSILCYFIKHEPDLKEIPYLWIDAISMDQQNHAMKKETILKMSTIYKKAAYILAVPDLHKEYLWKNIANRDMIALIKKYRKSIYESILNNINQPINKNEVKGSKFFINDPHQSTNIDKAIQTENEDIKKAYQYLANLIQDWSNRAWVISEYQIAEDKYENHRTPLKYIFMYLLHNGMSNFFSYSFDQQAINVNINNNNNNYIFYQDVDNSDAFISFLKTRFIRQNHINMILNSDATKNEDRFNAILPSWDKYNHWIKDKNTISNWNITDMTSIRLKLYELMDDVWDKAKLLRACSHFTSFPILPSYASFNDSELIYLYEKDNIDLAYEDYSADLLKYAFDKFGNVDSVKYMLDNINNKKELIYTENLITIQLNSHHHYLSIKAIKYFIHTMEKIKFSQEFLSTYSLKDDGSLRYVRLPFFTFTLPGFTDLLPREGNEIFLIGDMDQNRWILLSTHNVTEGEGIDIYLNYTNYSCCTDGYTFNIY